jgi:multimeric flavodoxin WrbA
VKEVLKHLRGKRNLVSLAGLNINPCDSCDRCWKENVECVIDDDIRWIIKEMEKADAIILGSPCYWGMVSAQLKMLLDRSVSIYEKNTAALHVIINDERSDGKWGKNRESFSLETKHQWTMF